MVPSNVALREEPFSGVKTRPESAAVHTRNEPNCSLFLVKTRRLYQSGSKLKQ
jgi:hypothetical protein